MLTPGQQLFEYRILAELGQGGFGAVYLAEDTLLKRSVAIKELDEAAQKDPVAFQRFLHEARLAGNLHHPNVVAVHALKMVGTTAYLVMEYLEGGSLRGRLEQSGRRRVSEVIRLGYDMSAGLAAVHTLGVVHRDIKPENILLTADGHAKIADFGIAHIPTDGPLSLGNINLTAKGFQPGTLIYMSPEQIRGDDIDFHSDIYQLGVVLYEMLSGCHYLDTDALWAKIGAQAGRNAMLRQAKFLELLSDKICSEDPVNLARTRPDVGDWLVELIASMMATDPAARPIADEVAYILKAHLNRDELSGDLESSTPPWLVIFAGTSLCPQCGCRIKKRTWTCPYCGLRLPTPTPGLKIDRFLDRSEAICPTNLSRLELLARLGKGPVTVIAISPDERRCALAYDVGMAMYDAFSGLRLWSILREGIRGLVFSPDSCTLTVTVEGESIQFWDVENGNITGTRTFESGPHSRVTGLQYCPNGKYMAVESGAAKNQTVHLFKLPVGQHVVGLVAGYMPIGPVAVSPDSSLIALAYKSDLRFWYVTEDHPREPITLKSEILAMAFSSDGTSLAVSYQFRGVEIVAVPDLSSAVSVKANGFFPYYNTLAFSPDGALLAGTNGSSLELWRASDGQRLAQVEIELDWSVRSDRQLRFSRDGRYLLLVTMKPSIERYQVPNLIEHRKPILFEADRDGFRHFSARDYAFSSDCSRVAYRYEGSTMRAGSLTPDLLVRDLEIDHHFIFDLAFDGKGRTLAVQTGAIDIAWYLLENDLTAHRHTGRIGETHLLARIEAELKAEQELEKPLFTEPSPPSAGFHVVRVSQDGKLVAAAGGGTFGHVTVWEATTEKTILCREVPTSVTDMTFTRNGSMLACAEHGSVVDSPVSGTPARVSMWDVHRCKLMWTWQTQTAGEASLAFSPDGRRLAVIVRSCYHRHVDYKSARWAEMYMWDVAEGRLLCSVPYQKDCHGMSAISFSPDGELYAIHGALGNDTQAIIFRTADNVSMGSIRLDSSAAGQFSSDWTLYVKDHLIYPELWGLS